MAQAKRKSVKYPRLRLFFLTCALSFFLLTMVAGFIIADYNTRSMGFGDASLCVDVYGQDNEITLNMLGRQRVLEIPETPGKWVGRIWNILPPGVRAMFWIFEGECEATYQIAG